MENNNLTEDYLLQTLTTQSDILINAKKELRDYMIKTRDMLPQVHSKDAFRNCINTIKNTYIKKIPKLLIKYVNLEENLMKFAETDNRMKDFDFSDEQKARYEEIMENLHSKNILKDKSVEQWHDSIITNINDLQALGKNLKIKWDILRDLINKENTLTRKYHDLRENIKNNIKENTTNNTKKNITTTNLKSLDKNTLHDLEKCQEELRKCLDDKKSAMTRLQEDYALGMHLMNSIIEKTQYDPDLTMDHYYNPFEDNLIVKNLDKCIENLSMRIKSLEKNQSRIISTLSMQEKKENALLADKPQNPMNNRKIRKSNFEERQNNFNPTANHKPDRIQNSESGPVI